MIGGSANEKGELAYQSREDRMFKLLKNNLKDLETSFNVVSFALYRGGGGYEG